MPVYEYECPACKKVFEVQQRMSEAPLQQCPDCGGAVNKLISMSSFQLKGGGWYADGYGAGAKTGSTKGKPASDSSATPSCQSGGACKGCPAAAA